MSIVPPHVGVIRDLARAARQLARYPHARGGDPVFVHEKTLVMRLSPRAWG